MFESPTTWLGVAVLAIIVAERAWDRWMRWKESRAWRREGTDRRQAVPEGNPNGLTRLANRLDERINLNEQRLDTFKAEQRKEWAEQRKRDGAIHERIGAVDRNVARIEGLLGRPPPPAG